MPPRESVEDRLLRRRQIVGDCWVWDGYRMPNGYAQVRPSGERRFVYVHRAAYELWVRPIPEGHEVHHRCGERACYNPAHLEARPLREHRQHHQPVRSHCQRGHSMTGDNIYIDPKRGKRHCQECRKAARERWRKNDG